MLRGILFFFLFFYFQALDIHVTLPEEELTEFGLNEHCVDYNRFETSSEETSSEEESDLDSSDSMYDRQNAQTDYKYTDKIHPELDCSKLSALQMILSYFMKHNLTQVALEDLLVLVNSIIGNSSLPQSKYHFFKLFSKKYAPKNVFFCTACYSELLVKDVFKNVQDQVDFATCNVCNLKNTTNELKKDNFFVTYPLEHQLKDLIMENFSNLQVFKDQYSENLSDIHDGQIYQRKPTSNGRYELTLTLNTDGVQVFKSKNKSLWPIQMVCNELEPEKRFLTKNIIVTGLWYQEAHPPMKLLLKPLMKEVNDLKASGLKIKIMNKEYNFNISIICVTLDAPAKAVVQNLIQFNGYFSCSYCEHPGVSIGTVKFPNKENVQARNHATAITQMVEARDTDTIVCGFKGISALTGLADFDMIQGFAIDYLHAVCEGVVKFLLSLWFDSTNFRSDYYIRKYIDTINSKIEKIQLPSEIERKPRSLNERHKWKANELRSWLLYYSVGVLHGILPEKFLTHYVQLVAAIRIYIQKDISHNDLILARTKINFFVKEFEELYGTKHMRYNVHTISHIPDCVANLGPLWVYSNFPFENNNGKLVSYVKSPKGVLNQISNKYTLAKKLSAADFFVSATAIKFHDFITKKRKSRTTHTTTQHLGKMSEKTEIHLSYLNTYNIQFECNEFFTCARAIIENVLYSTTDYSKSKKSNDSIIKLKDNTFGKIIKICVQSQKTYLIIEIIETFENLYCDEICLTKESNKETFIIVPELEIEYKCVLIESEKFNYIVKYCNFFDKD